LSEAISFEIISALFNAQILRTEKEIEYAPGSKITDYSISLFGKPIGVSVTRAMKFEGNFTEKDALSLLSKKLTGVNLSTLGVKEEHSWERQILHVFAQKEYIADLLHDALNKVSSDLLSDTIIIITVSENAPWIFTNPTIPARIRKTRKR